MTVSNTGFEKGKHLWRVKCINFCCGANSLGIVSNLDCVTQDSRDGYFYRSEAGTSYYIHENGSIHTSSNGSKKQLFASESKNKWAKGDVIAVGLDCDSWKITFWKNGTLVKTADITTQVKYYPAVGTCSSNNIEFFIES